VGPLQFVQLHKGTTTEGHIGHLQSPENGQEDPSRSDSHSYLQRGEYEQGSLSKDNFTKRAARTERVSFPLSGLAALFVKTHYILLEG
jgi:hypothetical protein